MRAAPRIIWPIGLAISIRLPTIEASSFRWICPMLKQNEANPTSEHQLYLVLFITNGGGV
jgi:hypothetical protein